MPPINASAVQVQSDRAAAISKVNTTPAAGCLNEPGNNQRGNGSSNLTGLIGGWWNPENGEDLAMLFSTPTDERSKKPTQRPQLS